MTNNIRERVDILFFCVTINVYYLQRNIFMHAFFLSWIIRRLVWLFFYVILKLPTTSW